LWPAVIDFIMALHDVLNESSQAEFSKLAASVGTLAEMVQLDFVLNGLMPAKWRDRIVKFLKKHIQLAQEQARQDTAVRERTLLENQRLEAAIQREKAAASFSATLERTERRRVEGKATKTLMGQAQRAAQSRREIFRSSLDPL
jgi:hypothetical protein